MFDLIIKGGTVVTAADTIACDVGIKDGRVIVLAGDLDGGAEVIDAAERLCVAGFVEPHIHLDKALINEDVRPNVSGTLDEAIEIIWERKRAYTVEEIAERAGRVIR